MPATKPEFNPAEDTPIATFFLHQDESGGFYDIDTHLYHSSKHGFYLQEKRAQVWIGRCWENVSESILRFAPADARRRMLTSTCRPLTPAQVIRLIINEHVPEEEGARDLALRALAKADIEICPSGHPTS